MGRIASAPRAAMLACAFVVLVWLNQGPTAKGYDALVDTVAAGGHPALALWQPFAFAYRRSQDEEMYYAVMNAVRGAPFDGDVLLRERGKASAAFLRMPEADGRWHAPYAEVPFEYPVLLLPFLAAPAWLAGSYAAFTRLFGAMMGVLLLAAVALGVRAATAERGAADGGRAADGEPAAPATRGWRWWLAGAMFLAQGGMLIQRVDAIPTFFLALALWGAVTRKPWVLGVGVGLAAAAKILPIVVLLPLIAADRAAVRDRAYLARVLAGATVAVLGGFVLPMVLISPAGALDFLAYHASRGLQVESTYGAVLSLVALVTGHRAPATLSFGSFNVDTPAAWAFARAATPIFGLSVLLVTAWVARLPSPPDEPEGARADRFACAGLLALLCAWLFGKLFSPQYMTWAIPFAVALDLRRRRGIAFCLVLSMAIAQAYLRGFYDYVTDMRPLGTAALLARLLVLLVMAALVLRALRGGGEARARSAAYAGP